MKRALKWVSAIILTPVLLIVLLMSAFYIPPVQRWVVRELSEYASEQSGLNITIEKARITFLLDLNLHRLHIDDHGKDILNVKNAIVDLDFTRILFMQVGVESVELRNGNINTRDLITTLQLKGQLQDFHLKADNVDLRHNLVTLNRATINGCNLDIALKDTTVVDTTENTPTTWNLDIEKVAIKNSRILLHMPYDSMLIQTGLQEALLERGDIDLEKGIYRIKKLKMQADSLHYDLPYQPQQTEGLDPAHIALYDLGIDLENTTYKLQDGYLSANLKHLQLKEKCGLSIDTLQASLIMDSTSVLVQGLKLATMHSRISGDADLQWKALSSKGRGEMSAVLKANIGHQDVLALAGNFLPANLKRVYPQQPVEMDMAAYGNVDSLNIVDSRITMPTVIDIRTNGNITNVTDSLHLSADMKWDIKTMNLNFVKQYLGLNNMNLPAMTLHADTQLKDYKRITAEAMLQEGRGNVHLKGNINLDNMAYEAKMRINGLQIHDFLPHDSIYSLTANASIRGIGTDLLARSTSMEARADIEHLKYASWNMDSIQVQGKLQHGEGQLEMSSNNDLLRLQACAETNIQERKLKASNFYLDLNQINLYALGLSKKKVSASMIMHMEGDSDFEQTHNLTGSMKALEMVVNDTTFHPEDLALTAQLTPNSIKAKAEAGDLVFRMESEQGLDSLMARSNNFVNELNRELDSLKLEQDTLRTLLPYVKLHLHSGQRNPFFNILNHVAGYKFKEMQLDLDSNPEKGLSGSGYMHHLNTGAILLDTISYNITQQTEGISLRGRVKNGPKNKVVSFESTVDASFTSNGAAAHLIFLDAKGKKGIDTGLKAEVSTDALNIHFTPLNPIIAYRNFKLNEDNYIRLIKGNKVEAMIDLLADDGTGLKLFSTKNEEAQQDLSLSVNRLNLGELSSVIPFMPMIEGFLQGDFHYMQADSTITISTDMTVKEMKYEGTGMGDIGMNLVYFPNPDGSHYVDGIVTQNERDIAYLNGKYWEKNKEGQIDATAELSRLPFSLANAFVPPGTIKLSGYALGNLEVKGPSSNPILTGSIATDSLFITAEDYNINLRIPNDTLYINRSHIDLPQIKAYAAGDNPLTLDGNIDFRNLERVQLNLNIAAKNYQLINAPKTRNALAYGKVFVDINSRIWGTLDDLKVRGGLTVLGNTDVSYVLKDSPITVEDQLSDLVTFCDFSDTLTIEPEATVNQHLDIQMNMTIDPTVKVHCLLSDDGRDHIELQGGGNITLTYNLENDMQLFGRYTIDEGTMRYSIMAIPLNDFKIAGGSYVEFVGNIMNPRLSIAASERVKASVTENNVPKNVSFDVGLKISQTLEDMGLLFTLEAPEDMTVQNELSAMSEEERGRIAITMLVTGMYLNDKSSMQGGFSAANTMNAYLQGAINNLAGQALSSSVDLNFGIENNTNQSGDQTTDYSFSFRKRFWGNRVSIIIGGKISTGKSAVNTGQTIIDNVSMEYRLDKNSSRYVRLFYDRNYESLLEGQITEMGAGLVLRKRAERLRELFIFRKKKKEEKKEEKK
ncbi:MAG: translocation/assembly module TamB domain-containing protein [Bacteroidaceae bacterium]|nr:translocation/assembly module TamB domain-containing protein [Bacteroidaceae bacterium]